MNLLDFGVAAHAPEFDSFLRESTLLAKAGLLLQAQELTLSDGRDPEINVARVQYRVQTGGHPVPEDKIRSRYTGSLQLLAQAVSCADRAYLFDNSGAERVWIAEVTDGLEIEMKTDAMPAWFKTALWDTFE